MADTDANVTAPETAANGDSKTTVQTDAASVANAADAEVERLRKEADQAKMDAASTRNELAKIRADQEAARQKQLEEEGRYKELSEKQAQELKALKDAQEAETRNREISNATDEVLKDYPAEVIDIAKTTGIGLSDASDEAKTSLKEKLDVIKSKVAPSNVTVDSSNPNPATPTSNPGQPVELGKPRSIGYDDGTKPYSEMNQGKFHDYIKDNPGLNAMKQIAGYTPKS